MLTIVSFCFMDSGVFFIFSFSGICGCREEETDGCRASDDRPLIQVSVHRDPFRKHSSHFLCIHDICIGVVNSEASTLALFTAFVGFQSLFFPPDSLCNRNT